jgi:ribosomal-protein-alanine N-acetyltransferase
MSEGKFSNTDLLIETARLWLRPICLDDLDELHRLFSDQDVIRYLSPSNPMERGEVEVALQSMVSHWQRHGFGRLAIVNKDTGKMIGYSGLRTLEGIPEVVYTIAREYWGQGLATEAGKASLKYGFDLLDFDRIAAITKPDNRVSRHILGKLGLCFQGEAVFYGHTVAYYEIARRHYLPERNFFFRIGQNLPDLCGQNSLSASPQVS